MDLHCWQADGADGVPQGNTGVGITAGVDDDPVGPIQRILNCVDECAFMVGLIGTNGGAESLGLGYDFGVDFRQGLAPIDARLSDAQQVKVGTVQKED